jgi:hypothetical protein
MLIGFAEDVPLKSTAAPLHEADKARREVFFWKKKIVPIKLKLIWQTTVNRNVILKLKLKYELLFEHFEKN